MSVRISARNKGKYWSEGHVSTHEHILFRDADCRKGHCQIQTSVIRVWHFPQCRDELCLQRLLPSSPPCVPGERMPSGLLSSLTHSRLEEVAWKLLLNTNGKLRSLDCTSMKANKNARRRKRPFLFSFNYQVCVYLSRFFLLMSGLSTELPTIIQHCTH